MGSSLGGRRRRGGHRGGGAAGSQPNSDLMGVAKRLRPLPNSYVTPNMHPHQNMPIMPVTLCYFIHISSMHQVFL
jgi:hypothetical protein